MKMLWFKRPFDLGLASFGMILSFPLWLVFGLMIRITDRGPVFYLQERVGRGGKIFKAIKFRSMVKDAEKTAGPQQAAKNDPRVTKIGKFLRATAMDELPQLINIIKGDMSFVGPRALRPQEREVVGNGEVIDLSHFPGYEKRHSVRPGLTGIAQITLPPDAPRQEKFHYDLFYIEKKSLWLDLKLLFLSFWITFRAKWGSQEKKI